jgi:hypothetical protein
MLFFRSEAGIDRWSRQQGLARGETLSLSQLWTLAQAWYHNRMDPQYRGRRPEDVRAIFQQVGLHGSFWKID